MQGLFLMIVNGFMAFITFLDKFRVFKNLETAGRAARYLTRKTFIAVLAALSLAYFALLFAFTYFMFESVTTAYTLVSNLIIMVESGSYSVGSSSGQLDQVMQTFYYFINASGIATGLNAAFPFIASAVTFRLMKGVKEVFLTLYDRLKTTLSDMIMIITAA